MQMDAGLSGAFLIEPANPDASAAVDQEYTLLLDDFISSNAPHHEAQPQSNGGGMMGGMMQGGMMQGMMGGNPRVDTAYDTFTINGKAYPATAPLVVRRGDRVRLRLVNASNMQTFVMRLLGHTLEVTHVDGNPLRTPVPVDAVPIATAERYDVVFTADNPGRWPLYALDQEHRDGGLLTEIVYAGVERSLVAPQVENNLRIFGYAMADGIDFLPPADGRRDFSLTLSGGGMMGTGPDEWTINGGTMATLDPLRLARNQLGVVRMVNMSAQSHPMHLHGQSFRVMAVNGVRLRSPLVKDTVDIAPHMGSADIEFAAFNPGRWMFHCHKPMHMEGGMGVMVEVAE
jgi:FtsP/CotA-like multicopper oxidase with cupredoxin domain